MLHMSDGQGYDTARDACWTEPQPQQTGVPPNIAVQAIRTGRTGVWSSDVPLNAEVQRVARAGR